MEEKQICKWCHREIDKAISCGDQPVCGHNQRWYRFPFGNEDDYQGEENCPDCLVPKKGFHHVHCTIEMCPRCRGKIALCGCFGK